MAITTVPYGQFVLDLGNGDQHLRFDEHFVMLLTDAYTPNTATDTFAGVSAFQLPNDSDADGYQTGGKNASISTVAWDSPGRRYTLNAVSVTWNKLTGSVRYLVIRNDANKLCAVCDLGTTTAYTAQPFTVNFPSGLFQIVGL